MVYLEVLLDSISFRASPFQKRVEKLLSYWRRILVLRRAASVILARALRSAVFNDSAHSGRLALDAVSSISPPSFLGSFRPDDPYQLDSRVSSGSGVVAESRSLGTRYFARPGVPSARLVVRRLGRGLGGSSRGGGHFRPLVSRGSGVIHQRQRALGCRARSSLFCSVNFELHGSRVRGQFYSDHLPSQPRGHSISAPQLHLSTHSAMGRVSSGGVGSTIHYGS